MSAIAGLWRLDGRPVRTEPTRMLDTQAAYGPDATGAWIDGSVGLGRRLMRLLPEDRFDRQPLLGAGGRLVLAADLRLDNREDLTAALGLTVRAASELSDADVLLAAYERWGEDCLSRLVGEYAFAVWDAARRRLLLARGPVNGRPLHYAYDARFFAFSTMPRGLHALEEVPRRPDEETLGRALDLAPSDETRTCFRNVHQVVNGSVVVVSENGVRTRNFWAPPKHRLRLRRAEDYQEALRETLDRAVASTLRGASDVAAQLSGGLDSTSVAASAARLLAPSGGRVVAFTAVPASRGQEGPANRIADEGDLAASVAALYPNMEHVRSPRPDASPLQGLDQALAYYDQPLLNLCNQVWLEDINRAASHRKLGVMLTGAMGNATLSYSGYDLLRDLMSRGRLLRFAREARALVAAGRLSWRGVIGHALPSALRPDPRARLVSQSLLRADRRAQIAACERPRASPPFRGSRGLVDRAMVLRTNHAALYRKGVLAQWRVDQRDPTADLRLVEFCLATPPEQFLRDGQRSYLARQAMADRLPPQILNEIRKGLQGADWHRGLAADLPRLRDEVEKISRSPAAARAIDIPRLRRMVDDWPHADWQSAQVNVMYRHGMLRAISIGSFLRMETVD